MTNQRVAFVDTGNVFSGAYGAKPNLLRQCPDKVLLNIATQLANRADINSLVCSSRQCYNALNDFLYKFDLGHDEKCSSALFWACCLSKYRTASNALKAGADPNEEWPTDMQEVFGNYSPEFEPCRGSSTGNALYIVASLGDIEMAKLLIGSAKADCSETVARRREPGRKDLLQPVRWEDPSILSALPMDCAELLYYLLQVYGDGVVDLSGSTILTLAVRE